MARDITFRTQLLGGVSEFCIASKLDTFTNALHLVELIVLLARYEEEGVPLFPKVYITNNIDLMLSMLPGSEKIAIANSNVSVEAINKAIKKCATLAVKGWMIYINEKGHDIEYGVFREDNNPIAVPMDKILMDEESDVEIVKVWQIAQDCVEVWSSNGKIHNVYLNHREESEDLPVVNFNSLVDEIVKKVEDGQREGVANFLRRYLSQAIAESHGCLIAVTNMDMCPKTLKKDGTTLGSPIDFPYLVNLLQSDMIKRYEIQSKAYLLSGFLSTDGIVLFDSRARLLGYNYFINLKSVSDVHGGARKRAYIAIKNKIGSGFSAIYMKSQDGEDFFSNKDDADE